MSQNHSFTFNGVNSANFGVTITNVKNTVIPHWEGSYTPIPGRNGDFYTPSNRMSNVEVTYSCAIKENFVENYNGLINALMAFGTAPGYSELRDSVFPGIFRMAILDKQQKVTLLPNAIAGRFDLVFSCMPQRFLDSGKEMIRAISGMTATFTNPGMESMPYIWIHMSGASTGNLVPQDGMFRIDNAVIEVTQVTGQIVLDCETQNAYQEVGGQIISMNEHVRLDEFPRLAPGEHTVKRLTDSIDIINIMPRWWIV